MDHSRYGHRIEVDLPYEQAVDKAAAELKEEGFGILTTIDVKETLKKKLDVDFRRYVILGACNPPLAHRALGAELEVGLLLPCNVIVYDSDDGRTRIAAMDPMAALGIVGDNDELKKVAREADERLRRALERLEREHGRRTKTA